MSSEAVPTWARPYPQPRVPVSTTLSPHSLARSRGALPAIDDAPHQAWVTSGRAAIAQALRLLDVGQGDEILIPALHCTSMVDPAVWLGMKPVFYPLLPDTRTDPEAVSRLVSPRTRAIIGVHYFGFPQDLQPLADLADSAGLALIEDCAHCYFGEIAGRPVGSFGDYAIASALKFFPSLDGGVLASHRRPVSGLKLKPGPLKFRLKALLDPLELAWAHRSSRRRLAATPADQPASKGHRARPVPGVAPAAGFPDPGAGAAGRSVPAAAVAAYEFDPEWVDVAASGWTRLFIRLANRQRIVQRRRANFLRYLQAFAGVGGATPLYPRLPAGAVPYVFPLRVEQAPDVFDTLKRQGVPIVRFGEYLWKGMDQGVCPVATDLSRRLLQFPCHESLSASELDWIIDRIVHALPH